MDTPEQPSGLMSRLVSGIKDKTVKMAEDRIRKAMQIQESPEESILGFVASAVASGAQRLDVRVESNDLVLTHDGKMLHPNEVAALRRGSATHPDLSHALRLHLASPEGKVELQFLSPLGMHKALFHGAAEPAVSDSDLSDMKLAKMTTRLYLRGTGNYRRVNQAMGNELPEVALIRRRCFLAPLDLQIAARALLRYAHLPVSLATGTNFHVEPLYALAALPTSPNHGLTVDLVDLTYNLKCVKAGVCGIAKSAAEAGWYRLLRGVARPLPEVAWPARTWGFVVLEDQPNIDSLTRDIDLLSATLVNELYKEYATATSSRQVTEDTLTFLEQQRPMLIAMGQQAVDLDRTFLDLRQACSPSSDPKVLSSRLELASSLESQGNAEEAHRQYAEVLPIWESEALNHFDKYRFEEGAALWQKTLMLHEKLGTETSILAQKHLKLAEIGKEQRLGFAEQSYRRALQLYRGLPEPDRPNEFTTLLGLAEVLKKNRVLTDSLRYAEEAQKILLEINEGKETKDLVPVLKLQAELHDLMGDYARSTEFEQKALLLKFRR
jgi:tetratricopeptide (TPR) repeat protein